MKKGDRVICINASNSGDGLSAPLKKGREYIIYGVYNCDCGLVKFDVGLVGTDKYPMMCSGC